VDHAGYIDFGAALRNARVAGPAAIPEILAATAAGFGATDVVVSLVDFGQTTLEPLPDHADHDEAPRTEEIVGTMAGRAFTDQQPVTATRDDGIRVWVPVLEGSDRTGVIAVTLPSADDGVVQACEELGLLAGYLIAAQARCTDLYDLHRRRESMSLAASMQWDLLPPLVLKAGPMSVAGLVEPAYDVGGDCFDYAANGYQFDFAIIDAMGHGIDAAVISSLAVGCYRHDRRESRSLVTMHENLASTIEAQFDDGSFATGILGRIDIRTGALTWTNAGHPRPLLVRGGKVVGELEGATTWPWGTVRAEPVVATEQLEPGDSVLLYTDGVTEARTPDGEQFGLDRLIDLTGRNASSLLPPEQIVRGLVADVRDFQGDDLADDATIVLVRWDGDPPAPALDRRE